MNGMNEVFQLIHKEFKSDNMIDSWLFISSPWPICIILTVYLTFVLKLGPTFMKTREPINIKYIMLFYNLMQVVFNSYILVYQFITPELPSYLWNYSCYPDSTGTKNYITQELHKASWYFSVSKIMDLFDTVFFILRKKDSHVSFLHVYHHINMVVTCFFHLRFIKSENAALGTIVNSFVHIVMYSYYFLTALGPNVRKHLWWKKYLTCIQIIQFIIAITYCISLYAFDCTYPRLFIVYVFADIVLFLYMFLKFYKKTYKPIDKTQ
ncbi:elongation of very long chain fatty acids protein 4-like isoform X2 [Sipha flava]|uniref:Elongation of very long chain fatty acids protein n=1 Tax=Sipha flava TaxID=143950 RepID=A0A8B8G0Z0_9HEMI|nr:elongation of very long chain fatty acids protein 4-like isoform X2 [Sipha flava]